MVSVIKYNKTHNMSLKRNLEQHPEASLINVMNGQKHEIRIIDEPFVIGRNRSSSLLIEESYISRVHCIINFTSANTFILSDNFTTSGTFLNNEIIPKGTKVVLIHGDTIGFGLKTKLEFIYKFVVKTDKRIKLSDHHTIENMKNELEKYRTTTESFTSTISKLRLENTKLEESVNLKVGDCNKKLKQIAKSIEQIEALNNKQKDLKSIIIRRLEDDFQCCICNELLLKATIGNCNHSFCERCITTWFKKSRFCPVCRATISSTSNCIAVDNFIKDLSELFGGSFKAQRDTLEQERNISPRDREARARARRQRRFARSIEVVDLTNF